jgi:hypothetical protein
MIVWFYYGKCLQGRTSQVPERLAYLGRPVSVFVATHFFHIAAFPLIPLRTFAVTANPGLGEELALVAGIDGPIAAVPIRFSLTSMLVAYLRAILVFGFLPAGIAAIVLLRHFRADYETLGWFLAALACVGPFVVWLSYRLRFATPARAQYLRELFGVSSPNDSEPR